MAVYADLTLLGGRHRPASGARTDEPVARHHLHNRVACAFLADGNAGWPAVTRTCSCAASVLVSTPMLEPVDSGELWPTCWACYRALSATLGNLELHHRVMPTLYAHGRSADAVRCLAHLNALASRP